MQREEIEYSVLKHKDINISYINQLYWTNKYTVYIHHVQNNFILELIKAKISAIWNEEGLYKKSNAYNRKTMNTNKWFFFKSVEMDARRGLLI